MILLLALPENTTKNYTIPLSSKYPLILVVFQNTNFIAVILNGLFKIRYIVVLYSVFALGDHIKPIFTNKCVTDLEYQSKMIIFGSILTTLESSSIFGVSWGTVLKIGSCL